MPFVCPSRSVRPIYVSADLHDLCMSPLLTSTLYPTCRSFFMRASISLSGSSSSSSRNALHQQHGFHSKSARVNSCNRGLTGDLTERCFDRQRKEATRWPGLVAKWYGQNRICPCYARAAGSTCHSLQLLAHALRCLRLAAAAAICLHSGHQLVQALPLAVRPACTATHTMSHSSSVMYMRQARPAEGNMRTQCRAAHSSVADFGVCKAHTADQASCQKTVGMCIMLDVRHHWGICGV